MQYATTRLSKQFVGIRRETPDAAECMAVLASEKARNARCETPDAVADSTPELLYIEKARDARCETPMWYGSTSD